MLSYQELGKTVSLLVSPQAKPLSLATALPPPPLLPTFRQGEAAPVPIRPRSRSIQSRRCCYFLPGGRGPSVGAPHQHRWSLTLMLASAVSQPSYSRPTWTFFSACEVAVAGVGTVFLFPASCLKRLICLSILGCFITMEAKITPEFLLLSSQVPDLF